jgi:hypothetical protein
MLPNLIIIGAGKAGTTSLHRYLDEHPDVYMCHPKEARFFIHDGWRAGLEWYESLFPKPALVRGEATPSYSIYPITKGVPSRIHDLIPDAKLMYIVRDPIERIPAHYSQRHVGLGGKETRSLDEAVRSALRHGDDPVNPYLAASRYATQLERYLEYFPLEQILVIDNAELRSQRKAVLREVFRFLGIDESFESPRFEEDFNTRSDQRGITSTGAKLRDTSAARFVRSSVPTKMRRPITRPLRHLLSRNVSRPNLSSDLREELVYVLKPEVDRLRELTGKPFASWSV